MALRQKDRRAGHAPVELEERDDRAGEGDRADRESERHLDDAAGVNDVALFDAEGLGRVKRPGGDQHGGQADQRMEHRHQLRHRRHLHGASAPRADAPADGDPENDEQPGERTRRRTNRQRRHNGDRHADHAEAVALTRGRRRRQSSQRQNEQNAGDEIEQSGEVGVHAASALLLVHRQHALGDQKAAENVDRGEDERNEADEAGKSRSAIDRGDSNRQQGADDDDRRNGVGLGHQRRVQRRRHRPHHVVADEDRERENREPEHERIDRSARSGVARRSELVAIGLRGLGGLPRGVSAAARSFSIAASRLSIRFSGAQEARKDIIGA